MKPNIAEWTTDEIGLEARRMFPEDSDHELRARYIKSLTHLRFSAIARARRALLNSQQSNR